MTANSISLKIGSVAMQVQYTKRFASRMRRNAVCEVLVRRGISNVSDASMARRLISRKPGQSRILICFIAEVISKPGACATYDDE